MNIQRNILASGRGDVIEQAALSHLAVGALVTTSLSAARDRYERFFGMECVEYAPGRMMARDRRAKYMMDHGMRDFFLLDVVEVDAIEHPQSLFNHWGFSVRDEAEVDRIRQIALSRADEFGLKKIHPTSPMHGSYGFYMIDVDDNWWEIEFRRGVTHDLMFSRGDWNAPGRESFPIINPDLPIARTPSEVFGDEVFMTHGTTAVADCDKARPFYEDILNLRAVRHARPSSCIAGGGDFGVVGVAGGLKAVQDQGPENRFVILADDDIALAELHDRVVAAAEAYGLSTVTDISPGEFGGNAFLLRTADNVWFEISSRTRQSYIDMFR